MRKKLKEKVLAEGEVTGHAHRVGTNVFEEDGVRYFEGETEVVHEEHNPIPLTKKKWASDKVREYDYFEEEARKVRD